MISRYLLFLVAEKCKMKVILHPKPYDGVNGSGCHINISTNQTKKNINAIYSLMIEFEKYHQTIIESSGLDNDKRLSGKYETSDLNKFSYGIGTRNTSIRIPISVKDAECGYFEDRRPASNVNPYIYCNQLLNIVEENYLNN